METRQNLKHEGGMYADRNVDRDKKYRGCEDPRLGRPRTPGIAGDR